jgi:hypothetical protein
MPGAAYSAMKIAWSKLPGAFNLPSRKNGSWVKPLLLSDVIGCYWKFGGFRLSPRRPRAHSQKVGASTQIKGL